MSKVKLQQYPVFVPRYWKGSMEENIVFRLTYLLLIRKPTYIAHASTTLCLGDKIEPVP
jgi:hypothetical protein